MLRLLAQKLMSTFWCWDFQGQAVNLLPLILTKSPYQKCLDGFQNFKQYLSDQRFTFKDFGWDFKIPVLYYGNCPSYVKISGNMKISFTQDLCFSTNGYNILFISIPIIRYSDYPEVPLMTDEISHLCRRLKWSSIRQTNSKQQKWENKDAQNLG